MTVLKLHCPNCRTAHEDPFEVLDADEIDSMCCEECKRQFWFAIMECHHCAHEQAFIWNHQPAPAALDLLTCEACTSTFRYQHATVEEQQH